MEEIQNKVGGKANKPQEEEKAEGRVREERGVKWRSVFDEASGGSVCMIYCLGDNSETLSQTLKATRAWFLTGAFTHTRARAQVVVSLITV